MGSLIRNCNLLPNGLSYRVALYRRPRISRPFPKTFPLGPIPSLHSQGRLPYKIHVFHTNLAFTSKRLFLQGSYMYTYGRRSISRPFPAFFSLGFIPYFHYLGGLLYKIHVFIQNWRLLVNIYPNRVVLYNRPRLIFVFQHFSALDLSPIFTTCWGFHTQKSRREIFKVRGEILKKKIVLGMRESCVVCCT